MFSNIDEIIISDFTEVKLNLLKEATLNKNIVKGLRETIREIKRGNVKEVFLCTNNDLGDKYNNTIKSFTKAYLNKDPIIISDFHILRDIVISTKKKEKGKNSELKFGENCSPPKNKGPKCFCAAIVNNK